MTTLRLSAGTDLVERLSYDQKPIEAVIELIWNGLDADANSVSVQLDLNASGSVVGIRVIDDGHGIRAEEIQRDFGRIGQSLKKTARLSPSGRPLHGKFGQGRLRAFALGDYLEWSTTAVTTDGKVQNSTVTASSSDRSAFDFSLPIATTSPTGTTVSARGRESALLNRLTSDLAREKTSAALAPYLLAHPSIRVTYNGVTIQPQENIKSDQTISIMFVHHGQEHTATLRVIEWLSGTEKNLYLCDQDGVPVDEVPVRIAPDFAYAAYLMWQDMPQHKNDWILAEENDQVILGVLLAAAKDALKKALDILRSERRKRLIQNWKESNTYPYEGEATSGTEELERATFDHVATQIYTHIPAEKRRRRLMLGLLKGSLKHQPEQLARILGELLSLPAVEREQLDRLLDRTSLVRIIHASTKVTDRLDFLTALEYIVFDQEVSRLTNERDHLHRLLERELWIFGEQYNMMLSERTLTTVLQRHLQILGRPMTGGPVIVNGSARRRIDLMLSVATKEHDRNRHLVVELKAPHVDAGDDQLAQLKKYANAVSEDARFRDTSTSWDFLLVAKQMSKTVRAEATQRNRPRGLVLESGSDATPLRIWVRTWGELIEDARQRLAYYRDGLNHDPTLGHSLDYLSRTHDDVIPTILSKSDTSEKQPADGQVISNDDGGT